VLALPTLAGACGTSGTAKLININLPKQPPECKALTPEDVAARQPDIPDDPDLALLSAEYIAFTKSLVRERTVCDRWQAARDAAYRGAK